MWVTGSKRILWAWLISKAHAPHQAGCTATSPTEGEKCSLSACFKSFQLKIFSLEKQVVVTVVSDGSLLPVLTSVAFRDCLELAPQVLLTELEGGVHKSLRVCPLLCPRCEQQTKFKRRHCGKAEQCREGLWTTSSSQLLLRSRPVLVSVPCERCHCARRCSWSWGDVTVKFAFYLSLTSFKQQALSWALPFSALLLNALAK